MKILKGRSKELYSITSKHLKADTDNNIGFLTLTIKHKKSDKLKYNLDALNENWRKLQNQRFFRNIKKEGLYLGQIKALEITHTKNNGWHPHLHVLLLWQGLSPLQIRKNQDLIIRSWVRSTGGSIDAQDEKIVYNKDISEYITKWDSIQELTNDFSKSANGVKPFQLLNLIYEKKLLYDSKNILISNNKCKAMFSEYVEATKGKHRIGISRNLNLLYKVEIKTDEEIINEISVEDIIVSFEREVWRIININHLQPHLLDIVHEQIEENDTKVYQINHKERIQGLILNFLNEFDSFGFIEQKTDNFNHILIQKKCPE
jgi:hypothetical protein